MQLEDSFLEYRVPDACPDAGRLLGRVVIVWIMIYTRVSK